jgi:hypothetical protein
VTAPINRYRDHSASVSSTLWLPLPLLRRVAPDLPDLTVSAGDVIDITDPECAGSTWRSRGARLVLDLEDVGRAGIGDHGRTIVVQNEAGVDDRALGQVVASLVLTTAAVLRGTTVLHATILRHLERTIALTAPSGTGKSTLAVALEQRGVRVHADDGCHVDDADPARVTTRGWSPLRLLPDAALALGVDARSLSAMPGPPWKKVYEPTEREEPSSYRLDALVVLDRGEVPTPTLVPIGRADAVPKVASSLYRRAMVSRLRGPVAVFDQATRVASAVPVAGLTVPDDLGRLDETADTVLELLWPS